MIGQQQHAKWISDIEAAARDFLDGPTEARLEYLEWLAAVHLLSTRAPILMKLVRHIAASPDDFPDVPDVCGGNEWPVPTK